MVMRYEPQPCPHCGHTLDATQGFDDDVDPRPGDVAVCAKCKGFLLWEWTTDPEPEFKQRKLTPREFNDLPGDLRADLLRAQAKLEEIERSARKPS